MGVRIQDHPASARRLQSASTVETRETVPVPVLVFLQVLDQIVEHMKIPIVRR